MVFVQSDMCSPEAASGANVDVAKFCHDFQGFSVISWPLTVENDHVMFNPSSFTPKD
jgi:hypothetical protein